MDEFYQEANRYAFERHRGPATETEFERIETADRTRNVRHVTHGRAASIAACEFRGLSHESLACLTANLLVALKRTTAELERQANDPEACAWDGIRIAELSRYAIAAAEQSDEPLDALDVARTGGGL